MTTGVLSSNPLLPKPTFWNSSLPVKKGGIATIGKLPQGPSSGQACTMTLGAYRSGKHSSENATTSSSPQSSQCTRAKP
jgi:hypothetical protein